MGEKQRSDKKIVRQKEDNEDILGAKMDLEVNIEQLTREGKTREKEAENALRMKEIELTKTKSTMEKVHRDREEERRELEAERDKLH